jgi:hypothetical protein
MPIQAVLLRQRRWSRFLMVVFFLAASLHQAQVYACCDKGTVFDWNANLALSAASSSAAAVKKPGE